MGGGGSGKMEKKYTEERKRRDGGARMENRYTEGR